MWSNNGWLECKNKDWYNLYKGFVKIFSNNLCFIKKDLFEKNLKMK